MNFIPLSKYRSFYNSVADLYNDEALNEFINKVRNSEGIDNDVERFLNDLNDPNRLLFYGWIDNNPQLEDLLVNQVVKSPFTDKSGVLKHQLKEKFSAFISPFLSRGLLKVDNSSLSNVDDALSYNVLLDEDHVNLVENHLFKPVREYLEKLDATSYEISQEQELVNWVKPICSDAYIGIINGLSRSSYALKVLYLEVLLRTIESKGTTVRYANWVLKELEKLELNKEHQEKIKEFRAMLRQGELKVRNKGEGKTPFRWKPFLFTLLVLIIGGGAFYIIKYKPFSDPANKQIAVEGNAFKSFSKVERMRIDSLIKTMPGQKTFDQYEVDPGYFIDDGTNIQIRQHNPNNLMDKILEDYKRDVAIRLNQQVDTCENLISFTKYNGTKSIDSRSGDLESFFRNESEYDAIFYVAEVTSNGKVYSFYLKAGDAKTINLKVGDLITYVLGSELIDYKFPANINTAALPSDDFKQHFCEIDYNYIESISNTLSVRNSGKDKAKFMLVGSKGDFVQLADLQSVLTSY